MYTQPSARILAANTGTTSFTICYKQNELEHSVHFRQRVQLMSTILNGLVNKPITVSIFCLESSSDIMWVDPKATFFQWFIAYRVYKLMFSGTINKSPIIWIVLVLNRFGFGSISDLWNSNFRGFTVPCLVFASWALSTALR